MPVSSVSTANGALKILSRSFYIDHKKSATFARKNLDDEIPIFKTLEDWEKMKSTKVDTCARLAQHLLVRDDAPEIILENGTVMFPPFPNLNPGEIVKQETKILIYQEYPSLGSLLRNVSFISYFWCHR